MATRKRRSVGPRLEVLEDRSVPAVIGGIVYNDVNLNGLFGPGEPGIAGSTLQLRDEAGGLVATATSGPDGRYQFTERNAGNTGPATTSFDAVFTEGTTDLTRSAGVSQFDPVLGTLTSVELIAEGSVTANSKMENLATHQASVKAEYRANFAYQIQGVSSSLTSSVQRDITGSLAAFDGQADLEGASSKDFGPVKIDGQFSTVSITDPSQLAAFVGTGTLQVSQQAEAEACSCGPGNLLSMVRTTAQGKVKVVYHYTPSNEIGPGKYTIIQTPQPPGFIDGRETKDNTTAIPGSERTDTIPVEITGRNEQSPANNFGESKSSPLVTPPLVIPPGSFGKYLFFDLLV